MIRRQHAELRRFCAACARGFIAATSCTAGRDRRRQITRTRLFSDLRHEHGPFDIIGDVHGCDDELQNLLSELGYSRRAETSSAVDRRHPPARRAVFVGDLVDRAPTRRPCSAW